ncbi:MAG: histidine utilization repressor [Rubrivivax sp.]|nr:histidine utilization repressor [Rubrivivax sp.]
MSGEWPVGDRIPTEEELAAQFQVSRMTVHRAVRELTADGLVHRRPGAGTFVANERPSLDLVAVRNIAEDVRSRGHTHSSVVHRLRQESATPEVAESLGLKLGAKVFHSLIVHLENNWPIQLEDRYVNPKAAPEYLKQDFATHTPNAYLMTVGPLERVEHTIEAVLPSPATCELLRIHASEPCLLLHRRTWSMGRVVSRAWLTHPGSRYRLGASFGRAVAGKE